MDFMTGSATLGIMSSLYKLLPTAHGRDQIVFTVITLDTKKIQEVQLQVRNAVFVFDVGFCANAGGT